MAIKILRRGLPVIGYAKIGLPGTTNGGKQTPPRKLDHIELTGRERGTDGELLPDARLLERLVASDKIPTCGGKAAGCKRSEELARTTGIKVFAERGLPRRLPIVLPFNDLDLVLPHHLTLWRGRTAYCVGDGETAMRREEITVRDSHGRPRMRDGKPEIRFGQPRPHAPCGPECPYFRVRCKPFGKLRFILATQESVGGCFEFHTTSWNSLANLKESLDFIAALTGGVLAWIPLLFDVAPQTVSPMEGGPAGRAWIARVTFPGNPQSLLQAVTEQLKLRAPLMAQIRQLEASIRGESPFAEPPEAIEERRAEFDPDAPEEPVAIVESDGAECDAPAAGESGDAGEFAGDESPAAEPEAPEPPARRSAVPKQRELVVETLPEVEAALGAREPVEPVAPNGGSKPEDWIEALGW